MIMTIVKPDPEPVSCETFEEHASALLDGELEGASLAALEAHQATCESCARFLGDIAAIRSDAAGLPVLTPSRDLWTGIEERIANPVIQLSAPGAGSRAALALPPRLRRPWLAAAAGIALMASATALGYRLASPAAPAAVAVAAGPGADTAGTASSLAEAPRTTVSEPGRAAAARSSARLAADGAARPATPDVAGAYALEIDRMRAQLDQRRSSLDTGTVRVLETNLAIIDRAIRESQAALARDPASGLLNRQLSDALDEKLELMRTAIHLTSGA